MTEQMAAILERYHFEKNMSPDKFSFPLVPHVYRSDRHYLFPANCDIEDNKPQNAYKCREVLYDNKPMRFNQKSPILVIGNSFIETPMFYESYPKLLASKICFMPQSMRSDGDGPMTLLMQRFLSFPERCLKDKKVVILCLGTEHFFSRSRWLDLKEQDQIKMQKAKENN